MIIYIDMDNTLCDTYKGVERWANEKFHKNIIMDKEKFTSNSSVSWMVSAGISKKEAIRIRANFFHNETYWSDWIPIAVDAREVMEYLCKKHEVHIATSVFLAETPACMVGKVEWLKRNLPFYDIRNTIYTHFKYNLIGDILIDDVLTQLISEHGEEFPGLKITIDYPYNRTNNKYIKRAKNWKEIYDLLRSEE